MSLSAHDVPPASLTATSPLGYGEILAGKYRVDHLLGAGGMGLVLKATHLELDQPVAIKLMRDEALKDADARARFAREAKAVVRLRSQHVARVIDVGTLADGAPFLVMEYLEGCDLGTLLVERGELAIDEAVAYLLQICEGIAEAHGAGIVHRDLKPRNVFVTTGVDGKRLLKVLDFGISKLMPVDGATLDMALTKTTDVMGSPSYMAPEQLRSARDADERSDLWSLGVMLYECITGRLPWEAQSITELGAMVLRDPLRPMRELRADVPIELDRIVARCLEKERANRYAHVVELAHALEPHARGLANGSADRITSVARTSRHPPPARASVPDARSSSRVVVSGGTSVSWGETEPMPPLASPAPPPQKVRVAVIVGASVLVALLALGAYVLVPRGGSSKSTATPVLPEDRAAIRPPPVASAIGVAAPSATEDAPGAPVAARPPSTGMSAVSTPPIASIPRRAAIATAAGPVATAAPVTPAAPASSNAHDMSNVGRK